MLQFDYNEEISGLVYTADNHFKNATAEGYTGYTMNKSLCAVQPETTNKLFQARIISAIQLFWKTRYLATRIPA